MVFLHVLLKVRLLLEGLVRTRRTIKSSNATVNQQMLIERCDLSESFRALIAHVLLNLMMCLHVIIQVGYLQTKVNNVLLYQCEF